MPFSPVYAVKKRLKQLTGLIIFIEILIELFADVKVV